MLVLIIVGALLSWLGWKAWFHHLLRRLMKVALVLLVAGVVLHACSGVEFGGSRGFALGGVLAGGLVIIGWVAWRRRGEEKDLAGRQGRVRDRALPPAPRRSGYRPGQE